MKSFLQSLCFCALLTCLGLWPGHTKAQSKSPWIVAVDEKNGLPLATRGGANGFTSSFVFWGANWAWADIQATMKVAGPQHYTLAGSNAVLGLNLVGSAKKQNAHQMIWNFSWDARLNKPDVIGGGVAFKFDLSTFGTEMGEPSVLPDNRGWVWGKDPGRRMEMRFDPPVASLVFERGQKSELRAYFYKDKIASGKQTYQLTLTTGAEVTIGPSASERYAGTDASTWPVDTLDWKAAPVDLSFMNAPEIPAGKRGFVRSLGGKLSFGDGSPARFWGTNLTAYALFQTSKDATRLQAKRLSALGFNLVRLHHHDSPWVNPNIFGHSKVATDTRHLSAESLDRIDWWIKCLKDEGIYVWLDLHVQRALQSADNIFGFDEIRKGKTAADLKGYNYVNGTIQNAMQRFNEAYVNHINPYTKIALKDEPAIAAMLITNENDVTHHFGNALLPDKQVPGHNRLYTAEAESFAKANNLPKDKVWRSWEHGPSKLFLNQLEQQFASSMLGHLRALGVKAPLLTTSTWGNNPLSSLPALTVGDAIDVHGYGGPGQLEKNPTITANMVHWIAAAHVLGKPLTVTEWNVEPFPTADRHSLPLYMAGAASLQGWDALMQYAYTQAPANGPSNASNWHSHNDPALLATLPAAALMYRQGHIKEANTTYVFDPGAPLLFNQLISPATSPALRTATEKGKLLIVMPRTTELPWLQRAAIPNNAKVIVDPSQSLLDTDAVDVTSDTGELYRNWSKGLYTINTPRSQAAMGWIGGDTVTLPDVEIRAKTHNASIIVQSLDATPIAKSRNILISIGGRANPGRNNQTPFVVEPVDCDITIRAPQGLKLSRKNARQQIEKMAAPYRDGKYFIHMNSNTAAQWLFLKADN